MSCNSAVILALVVGSLLAPIEASAQGVRLAQLVPPAGSAGAGNSAISGVPFGPANPSVLSDPSGIGNASRMPPLGTNTPAPPVAYGALGSSPSSTRVAAPYAGYGASQRIISARQFDSRRHRFRPRGRAEVSHYTGICRGC